VPGDGAIDKYSRDHERTEEISFSAFVDPKVRFEHRGLQNLIVSEPGLPSDLWLKLVLNEVFSFFSLDYDLWTFFVDRDREFAFLSEKEHVWPADEFEALLCQQLPQFFCLDGG
jgi:hypothetical protein